MAKITWLGEDELHNGGAGPSFTHAFGGIKFSKGEAVDVDDEGFVRKALNNPFFSVDGGDDDAGGADKYHTMNVSDLRKEAASRGIDTGGMNKAEIRETLRKADAD